MATFVGSTPHPLLQDWLAWYWSQESTWSTEWRALAGRALSLACNDPFIQALIAARTQGALGPIGLRFNSIFDDTPHEVGTSDNSREIRRQITAMSSASWYGRDLDAEGTRTRWDLEQALDWMAFVLGDGFAIRVFRKGRSVWRLVTPDRVMNPGGMGNSGTTRDGFELDNDGKVIGVWVVVGQVNAMGVWQANAAPVYVPWYAKDGTPNVLHRVGFRVPGMLRGVSRLAPMIIMQRQLGGVLESHVAAKRLQAIHAMIIETDDPEAYKKAQETGDALDPNRLQIKGPLSVLVKQPGQPVQFMTPQFSGEDLGAYLELCYKVQCAAVQMPVDVVLCQMGKASLSSARAGLDQFDRTCQSEQERHIAEVTSQLERTLVSDALVRGDLVLPTEDWSQILAGNYARPPKYSTDRLKDAQTIAQLVASGVSRTTAFQMFGMSFEDEAELRAAEQSFQKAQGLTDPAPQQQQAPAQGADPEQKQPQNDDGSDPAKDDGKTKAKAGSWWRRILGFQRQMRSAA